MTLVPFKYEGLTAKIVLVEFETKWFYIGGSPFCSISIINTTLLVSGGVTFFFNRIFTVNTQNSETSERSPNKICL